MDDKALQEVTPCPDNCDCFGYTLHCAHEMKKILPQLSPQLRILLLRNVRVNINHIRFKEGKRIMLIQLNVTKAGLTEIEPSHLSRLTFLKNLNLSHNNIAKLKRRTFTMLKNLVSIDLSYNQLTNLGPDDFFGADMTKEIYLNNNSIQRISHWTFYKLEQLKTLILSNNKIDDLGVNAIYSLNLEVLNIRNNPLSRINETKLLSSFLNLKELYTSPREICCNVPRYLQCVPIIKLSSISGCGKLISSNIARPILWCAVSTLLTLQLVSIAWFVCQIHASPGGKNLYNIISLLVFVLGIYASIYFLVILSVDLSFKGYYSFFDATWRESIACNLLNTLSYSSFQTTMFLALLISCTRAIATRFPFKARDISMWGVLGAASSCFLLSTGLGYPGLTMRNYVKVPESALGLGLLLPSIGMNDGQIPWHSVLFVAQSTCILFAMCCFQTMLVTSLLKSRNIVTNQNANVARRKKAASTSRLTLLLILLQYIPLLTLHILRVFLVDIQTSVAVFVTFGTLWYVHIINVLIYCFASSAFRHCMCR